MNTFIVERSDTTATPSGAALKVFATAMRVELVQIHSFRGIPELMWLPSSGVNLVIGPGDSGKTSLLAAIGLALSDAPGFADETDFPRLDLREPFSIELLLSEYGQDAERALGSPLPLWGFDRTTWKAEGPPDKGHLIPVLRLQVRATADLELVHELLPLSGDPRILYANQRRVFNVWQFHGWGRRDDEFRTARGTAVEALIRRDELRPAAIHVAGHSRPGWPGHRQP